MSQYTFLLVDDDSDLREELVHFLSRYGIKVIDVGNAYEAREILNNQEISLVILDVVMPGETGLQLMSWIGSHCQTPVILLTALYDSTDKIVGLELGADDYMAKPFDQRELLARAHAILRRSNNEVVYKTENNQPETPMFYFDLNLQVLRLSSGKEEVLRDSESKLLEVLIKHEGQIVSRELLFDEVLGRSWIPDDRSIDNIIVRLRKLVEQEPNIPSLIKTVRNKGYIMTNGLMTIV